MKANEAPERIYCESDGLDNIVKVHNIKWPDDEAENIEYTRTDAFIKKACDWLTKHAKKYYFNKERFLGTEELVEDFKLSMEM